MILDIPVYVQVPRYYWECKYCGEKASQEAAVKDWAEFWYNPHLEFECNAFRKEVGK